MLFLGLHVVFGVGRRRPRLLQSQFSASFWAALKASSAASNVSRPPTFLIIHLRYSRCGSIGGRLNPGASFSWPAFNAALSRSFARFISAAKYRRAFLVALSGRG